MTQSRSEIVFEALREIAESRAGKPTLEYISRVTGLSQRAVGTVMKELRDTKRIRVRGKPHSPRVYEAADGSWSIEVTPWSAFTPHLTTFKGEVAAMHPGGASKDPLGAAKQHIKRLASAPPLTPEAEDAAIARFLATRGATICAARAVAPINNNTGF